MIKKRYKIRVRYADTDKMGVVYHGNFLKYYEIGRVELLRSIGITYKSIEDSGIVMPVRNIKVKFIKIAQYDDMLTMETILKNIEGSRVFFEYSVYKDNMMINKACTELVCVDAKTMKPVDPPKKLIDLAL